MHATVVEPGLSLADSDSLYVAIRKASSLQPVDFSLNGESGTSIECGDLDDRIERLAAELHQRGVSKGDRVAVLGRTSIEWALLDLAVIAIGAIVVTVYPGSSQKQIDHILADSESSFFAAESADDAEMLRAGGAAAVWMFEQIAQWEASADWSSWPEVLARTAADDPAMVVYTSGTTGLSKGCVITHRNMYAAAANTVVRAESALCGGTSILALPLAHVFGQTMLFAFLLGGVTTTFVPAVAGVVPALKQVRPTVLPMIPYGLEKIRKHCRTNLSEAAEADIVASGSHVLERGGQDLPSHPLAAEFFGGRLRYLICGGATFDQTTQAFFAGLGVFPLNCYGLTEAATAVTVSSPQEYRWGAVGRAIPTVQVAVSSSDEILVRGPNVSPGYLGGYAHLSMVDSDGWLHTGDLGEIDEDGYVYVRGRSKEILITTGGKNVAPTPLEDRVRLSPVVSNCIVLGNDRDFVSALITLDDGHIERLTSADETLNVSEAVEAAIHSANELVSRAESIRTYRIVPGDFTVESGLLTSSRKLRREAITDHYSSYIREIYGAHSPPR